MGTSMSTLGGWAVIIALAGYWGYKSWADSRPRLANQPRLAVKAVQRQAEDRQAPQSRKDPKEKAKRQRAEAARQASLAAAKQASSVESDSKPKPRSNGHAKNNTKTPTVSTTAVGSVSSDDDDNDEGMDNREFARQLASIKQGTSFTSIRKSDEKKQKSVKQSRAREMARDSLQPTSSKAAVSAPSARSSTTGIDGDDDTSAAASPNMQAADTAGVADMLEEQASGPSVLRLTDTDKVKPKEKKAQAGPEKTESKKQRQNRKKAEAAKLLREEAEAERKVAMEAQRRTARLAEGRPAQDGTVFMAAQQSAWNNDSNGNNKAASNGVNGTKANGDTKANGGTKANDAPAKTASQFLPVQPLAPPAPKADSWMRDLPSEEEQMELLRSEEAWSTVKTKRSKKKLEGPPSDSAGEAETPGAAHAEPRAPAPSVPAAAVSKAQLQAHSKPAKAVSQQSAFAALSANEVEQEWDV